VPVDNGKGEELFIADDVIDPETSEVLVAKGQALTNEQYEIIREKGLIK